VRGLYGFLSLLLSVRSFDVKLEIQRLRLNGGPLNGVERPVPLKGNVQNHVIGRKGETCRFIVTVDITYKGFNWVGSERHEYDLVDGTAHSRSVKNCPFPLRT
jgi:hypothetical protein